MDGNFTRDDAEALLDICLSFVGSITPVCCALAEIAETIIGEETDELVDDLGVDLAVAALDIPWELLRTFDP